MKKLTLILLLAIAKIGFCQNAKQDTTLIYNSPMYAKDPVRSKWRPVVKRIGELYQVTFYDRKDVVQEVINFEDKNLEVRKGPYTKYKNAVINEKGNYDRGHKNGEWITYSSPEKINKIENFTHGKLDGKYVKYWDGIQIQEEGVYENGRKVEKWNLFYKDGKTAGKEVYDVYGKKATAEYFLNDGKPATYEDLFSPPSYDGGIKAFYEFLATEIRYPKQAAKDRITGTVHVRFTVTKNGRIEDIEAINSPNQELAQEAIRVVQMSKNWIPGKQFGELVNVKYNIPIKFSLRQ